MNRQQLFNRFVFLVIFALVWGLVREEAGIELAARIVGSSLIGMVLYLVLDGLGRAFESRGAKP